MTSSSSTVFAAYRTDTPLRGGSKHTEATHNGSMPARSSDPDEANGQNKGPERRAGVMTVKKCGFAEYQGYDY